MDRLTELREAKQASETVLGRIDRALYSLGKAKNWGLWDIFSDGFFSSWIKRNHIRDSNAEITGLTDSLQQLSKELSDVQMQLSAEISDGFADQMWDVYFDNIITDFRVQGEIQDKLHELSVLRDEVQTVDAKLEEEIKRYQ